MTRAERRGLRNLQAPPRRIGPTFKWIVRIYYRSQENEILCCESDPLSRAGADALYREHSIDSASRVGWRSASAAKAPINSDALDAEIVPLKEARRDAAAGVALKYNARRVVLPSQIP